MSIPAAVAELNKEIAILDKEITASGKKKERLVSLREALLEETKSVGISGVDAGTPKRGKPGREPGAAKQVTRGRQIVVKKSVATKKRTTSAEAKKLEVPVRRRSGRPSGATTAVAQLPVKPKRTLSPEARERIRQGQVKRWAAVKKGKVSGFKEQPGRKSRTTTAPTS